MAANNSVASSLERFGERIGKSLIKYLKPIRVALPHFKEQKTQIQTVITDATGMDKLKSSDILLEDGNNNKTTKVVKDEIQEEIEVLEKEMKSLIQPDSEKNSWLDSVLFMLKNCKKSALKMKRKKAVSSYASAVQARSVGKFQSRGTIINLELGSLQFLTSSKPKGK